MQIANVLNPMVILNVFLGLKILFLGKSGPKTQNCLIKKCKYAQFDDNFYLLFFGPGIELICF